MNVRQTPAPLRLALAVFPLLAVPAMGGGEKAPAQAPPVTIHVNTKARTPIRLKFGFNEYVITASPHHPFNDPVYAETMKQSGANIMRFPGGTIGNFYDWKNDDFMTETIKAVSPKDAVPRAAFATGEEYQATLAKFQKYLGEYIGKGAKCAEIRGHYGYKDFLDMTRQIGADVFYMGNISLAPGGADPVEHLVAWMRQLKQDGVTVKYVELGNEIVTPKAAKDTQAILNGLWDLDRYMKVAETAARGIKAVFPGAKIGILADGLGNKIGTFPDEIDLLCRKISGNYKTDFYDAVVIHTYLRFSDTKTQDLHARTDKLFATSKKIVENSLEHWRTVFPGKEVWMTETGYIAGTKEDENNFTGCMFTAMLEADYYLRWLDNDDVATAYVKFYSISPRPTIKSAMFWSADGGRVVRTPVGHAYSLVAGAVKDSSFKLAAETRNSGGRTVQVSSWVQNKDAAGKKIPGKGTTKEVEVAVEDVMARAFLSNDSKTIRVAFVNKASAPRNVVIDIDGKPLGGAGARVTSISGELLGRNTLEAPDQIAPVSLDLAGKESVLLPACSVGVIAIPAAGLAQQ